MQMIVYNMKKFPACPNGTGTGTGTETSMNRTPPLHLPTCEDDAKMQTCEDDAKMQTHDIYINFYHTYPSGTGTSISYAAKMRTYYKKTDFYHTYPSGTGTGTGTGTSMKCTLPSHLPTCEDAAKLGSLKDLIYAREHRCKWTIETCLNAIKSRSIECLQYALDNGCPRSLKNIGINDNQYDPICNAAAQSGLLVLLQCAHEHGCYWSVNTCYNAAESGSIECLQYAIESGCQYNYTILTAAFCAGSLACLQYAHHKCCNFTKTLEDVSFMLECFTYNHILCLKYLFENGCTADSQLTTKSIDKKITAYNDNQKDKSLIFTMKCPFINKNET